MIVRTTSYGGWYMNRRRCDFLRSIAAIGAGTLIAFYCPTRVLVILLAISVVVLALAIPRN